MKLLFDQEREFCQRQRIDLKAGEIIVRSDARSKLAAEEC